MTKSEANKQIAKALGLKVEANDDQSMFCWFYPPDFVDLKTKITEYTIPDFVAIIDRGIAHARFILGNQVAVKHDLNTQPTIEDYEKQLPKCPKCQKFENQLDEMLTKVKGEI